MCCREGKTRAFNADHFWETGLRISHRTNRLSFGGMCATRMRGSILADNKILYLFRKYLLRSLVKARDGYGASFEVSSTSGSLHNTLPPNPAVTGHATSILVGRISAG
ncbi:hypothetical protein AVEN_211517-1 [Araneus ventricosus]|uniref:Uncharacterized protein n=1 Tax=Araneus ventricosus TaxID=182803 RepID=A0A4Y2C256_ARAVE|nr:hypothetical protein AVEN_54483-1 [Araneus ventricosus]GBL97847.1 hypothetical protein AVEN_211517-1 [Araneus ventricosus]